MSVIPFIMFFIWAAAMVLACWAVEVAQMFAKRMARAPSRLPENVGPRVAAILPIKGVDEDTLENVRALLAQDYHDCRFLFAVESADDPVVPVLERMAAEDRAGRIEVVIAGLAENRGQKVHNQLAAVDRTTPADEILVFMDADACPKPHWLRALVAPLQYDVVGATTGFRFYIPAGPHAANAFVSVINAAVGALLGPVRRNFAWGGSMAIRRKNLFDFGVYDEWQHALSDDYVLSYCVKHKAKSRIQFVPNCMVASSANFTWHSFFEFACRQYRITRVCAPHVWLTAVSGALVYLLSLAYTLSFGLYTTVYPHDGQPYEPLRLLLMFAALYLASVIRGYFLLYGGKRALPEHWATLRKLHLAYTWGYPLAVLVNLLALLGSAFGRNIAWRGVIYTMYSRTKTTVHRREVPAAARELAAASRP